MTVNIHDDYEPETNRVRAARRALNAYKVIRTVRADEPERDHEGMPYEPQAWLDWHEHDYQPATRTLNNALDNLELALGDTFPGRHPFNFVPLCQRIITNESWSHA